MKVTEKLPSGRTVAVAVCAPSVAVTVRPTAASVPALRVPVKVTAVVPKVTCCGGTLNVGWTDPQRK